MPRAIWTGSISFGLVAIPVKLVPAIRPDEDVHFHYLHAKDEGRITNVRKCEVCGKEVPWGEIVRGFEYQKGSYALVTNDELERLRAEASQAVEILAFVDKAEIEPLLYEVPYYLEPEKRGQRAYALLRDVLQRSDRVGIAQIVLRTRARLAALRPAGRALVVEMLRYPHEVRPISEVDLPASKQSESPAELRAAQSLVDAMTKPFDPEEYRDEYEEKLKALLRDRAAGKTAPRRAKPAPARATNVIDLADLLKQSLAGKGGKGGRKAHAARGHKRAS